MASLLLGLQLLPVSSAWPARLVVRFQSFACPSRACESARPFRDGVAARPVFVLRLLPAAGVVRVEGMARSSRPLRPAAAQPCGWDHSLCGREGSAIRRESREGEARGRKEPATFAATLAANTAHPSRRPQASITFPLTARSGAYKRRHSLRATERDAGVRWRSHVLHLSLPERP